MAVAVLLTASCAKEDISSSIVGGGEVEVTFSANLPELGTRANTYGNGANADILYYNVYEAGSDNQLGDLCGSVESNTGSFTFSLVLLKGMEYDLVFWAQDKDCGYYSLNGKQITVDYTDVDANDDTRDAFFRYVEGFDPTSDTPSFKLYRPFAQLNAAVSAADMTAVGKNEVTLTTSTVTVDTYTGFDISTGDVTGNKSNVTFKATTMPCNLDPAEELKADYTYVSMNYLLVPKIGMVSNVIYTFNATKNGGDFAFTGTSYNDVPLKQNFRTNILGALLTAPTQFTVEIEAGFNQPDQIPVNVADAQELQQALADPDINSIVLSNDIDLNALFNSSTLSTRATAGSYGLLIPAGKEFTIDLNGNTLTHSKACTASYSMIENKGKLTIEDTSANGDGKISFTDTSEGDPNAGWGSYTIHNMGTLIVNSGTVENLSAQNVDGGPFKHTVMAIFQYSGNTTINGGKISTPHYRSIRIWQGSLVVNDGICEGQVWMQGVAGDKASIEINGGSFAPVWNDGSSVFVENDKVDIAMTVNGGVFATKIGSSVPAKLANTVNAGTFGNLKSTLPYLAAGANISISEPLTVAADEELTLDLKGCTISQSKEQTENYQMILNDGVLVIEDSVGGGKLVYTDTGNGGNYISNTITNRGTLTVKGGTIENNSSDVVADNGYPYAIDSSIWGENQSVTNIEGGTIKSVYSPLRVRADSVNEEVIANISGGNIYGRIDHQMSSSTAGVKGTLNISDGNFYKYGTKVPNIMIFGAGVETDASGIKLNITGGTFDSEININTGAYVPLGKGFDKAFIHGGTFATLDVLNNVAADADIDIVLGNDVVTTSTATVAAGSKVALDLNGHNVSYAVENSGATAIIHNKGELNISNSGAEATISFVAANPDLGSMPKYATNTITNTGTLTIGENVVVTNGSDGGASYAVDNHSVFTLNGGKLVGNRCALRVARYNNPDVVFTMESGLIEAMTPAWIQLPGSNSAVAPNISVVIKDGILRSTKESSADNNAMYTYSYGNSHANTNITINGGQFLGGTVSIGSGYKGDAPTLTINGGVFEYDVLQWLENDQYDVIYKANK